MLFWTEYSNMTFTCATTSRQESCPRTWRGQRYCHLPCTRAGCTSRNVDEQDCSSRRNSDSSDPQDRRTELGEIPGPLRPWSLEDPHLEEEYQQL